MKSCGSCGQFHPKGSTGDCRDDANRYPVEDPTVVVFRKWRDGGVIALFPGIPGTEGFCSSYEHFGQHGDADYSGIIAMTKPALPDEYADLKMELESVPYNYILQVKKRRG